MASPSLPIESPPREGDRVPPAPQERRLGSAAPGGHWTGPLHSIQTLCRFVLRAGRQVPTPGPRVLNPLGHPKSGEGAAVCGPWRKGSGPLLPCTWLEAGSPCQTRPQPPWSRGRGESWLQEHVRALSMSPAPERSSSVASPPVTSPRTPTTLIKLSGTEALLRSVLEVQQVCLIQ